MEPVCENLDAPVYWTWDGWNEICMLQSSSCIDKTYKKGGSWGFYGVFQVHDMSGKAIVDVDHPLHLNIPSKVLKDHPEHPNNGFTSVFRTVVQLKKHAANEVQCGSALRVTGSIGGGDCLLLICEHCLPYNNDDEVLVSNLARGAFVQASVVVHHARKFSCVARSELEDVACIRTKAKEECDHSWETCFLPVMGENLKPGTAICAYSFPAAPVFLHKAHKELVLGEADHGVWKDYGPLQEQLLRQCGSVEKAKQELYNMLEDTWGRVVSGGLVASPGVVQCPGVVNPMEVLNSMLPGSSGGPVTTFTGGVFEFVGMHQSGKNGTNNVLSCDNVGFVKFYAANILPHIPPLSSELWGSRDLSRFHDWLSYHKLQLIM